MKTTTISLIKTKINKTVCLSITVLILMIVESNEVTAQVFSKVSSSEINSQKKNAYGVGWVDVNNDKYIDILVTNCGGNVELYLNNKDGSFLLANNNPITNLNGCNSGIAWGDYDNDGDNDLVITPDEGNNAFFDNLGDGCFQRNTNSSIISAMGKHMHCTWIDYDNDGWLDLFIPTVATFDFVKGGGSANFLYHNNGDGTFSKIINNELTNESGNNPCGNFADYDNDGDMDLFVAEWQKDNWFFENNGDGSFSKITGSEINTNSSISSTSCWGDYDNDGDLDLFIGNGSAEKIVDQKNFLYQNNGNKTFTKITTGDPVNINASTFTSMWGDVDNDGDLDLFIGQYGDSNILFINDGTGNLAKVDGFDVISKETSGAGFGDYDNDGFLDLFVANVDAAGNTLYHNNGNNNNWINITCKGLISNCSAIGARVKVKATIFGKSFWQIREINGNQGFRSYSDIRAHFGLGDASTIDSLMVIFPSGFKTTRINLPINQFISITEEIPDNYIKPSFKADVLKGKAKLTVQFNDNSIASQNYPITSWSWDFDNDGKEDSREQNPTYTYHNDYGALYSVSLTVSNGITTKTIVKNNLIEIISKSTANLALLTKATASSLEATTYPAEYATDGNMSTRWASKFIDPQWIMVELDTIYSIGTVVLRWANAYGSQFEIQTSLDTASWQTVYSEAKGNGRTDSITFSAVEAKYVRMYGTKRAIVNGYSLYEFEVYKSTTTGFEKLKNNEKFFRLDQNYPNPFNPETVIGYQIPASLNPSQGGTSPKGMDSQIPITLKIYDMLGREVATLVNEEKAPGYYQVKFSAGSCGDGRNLSTGVYIYNLTAGSFTSTKKLLLVK